MHRHVHWVPGLYKLSMTTRSDLEEMSHDPIYVSVLYSLLLTYMLSYGIFIHLAGRVITVYTFNL